MIFLLGAAKVEGELSGFIEQKRHVEKKGNSTEDCFKTLSEIKHKGGSAYVHTY